MHILQYLSQSHSYTQPTSDKSEKIADFCHVHSLEDTYLHFGGMCCFYIHGRRYTSFNFLYMEDGGSMELVHIYQITTQCHIPDDNDFHSQQPQEPQDSQK
jgi:hypothetical protein